MRASLWLFLVLLVPGRLYAQTPEETRARVQLLQQLVGGVEAYRHGWGDRGEAALRRAFEADPALVADTTGSVAYWLGRVLSERGPV